jgi:hypothetical protein
LVDSPETGNALDPIFLDTGVETDHAIVGVSGRLRFNDSATLTLPLLGSIRTIRDYTEGNSLTPSIQDAIQFAELGDGAASVSRQWLDEVTVTTLTFSPAGNGSVTTSNRTVKFEAGTYTFNASYNYPQLEQLSPEEALAESAQHLISEKPDQTRSLSFLTYTDKFLAGAWRFLTYFGRDSILSMLLLEPILSVGPNSSFEAGISSLLERINKSDGTVAHEETIGDYATYQHLQEGVVSSAPRYDYKMIDTDYLLPVVLVDYFVNNPTGSGRTELLDTVASVNPDNAGLTYRELAELSVDKIMRSTAAFAAPDGQTKENLIHLNDGQPVGEWRDSNSGLGGGRIPYDVNTALVPAGLRAIAALAEAGIFPDHPDWAEKAAEYAKVWEDNTLQFFEVNIDETEARSLVDDYVTSNAFPFPSNSDSIVGSQTFYGLALDGSIDPIVRVMNTDDCFRHFLLNTTNQQQLSDFLGQTADHILAPFPAGLTTDAGLVVANPAFGGDPAYASTFSNRDYHGTVVWSWQLAMMARGLERQLGRCHGLEGPDFCSDQELRGRVYSAYNRLWDVIEANEGILSGEMWTWRWEGDKFVPVPFGDVTSTESNIQQLWSLKFLAVTRNLDIS